MNVFQPLSPFLNGTCLEINQSSRNTSIYKPAVFVEEKSGLDHI